MTAFRVLVISSEGRPDWRMIEAANETGAVARVVADGLTPLDVRAGHLTLVDRLNQPVSIGSKPGIAEQSLILTQLALLIRSGLPVDRSIDLLRDQSPRASQRELLSTALVRIRGGGSLAQAFDETGAFPAYVIGVLRSAERSGKLGNALSSLAERMTLAAKTRRELVTALTYPAAVLVATILALFLVLTIVVPQFESVFAGEEARLPDLTRAVLWLSNAVNENTLIFAIVLIGVPVALFVALKAAATSDLVRRNRNRIPALALRDQFLAANLTGLLGTLVENGVPVIGALGLARSAMSSTRWQKHLRAVEQDVREGSSLSRALARDNLVPTTAVRLIEVGEQGGNLADTCSRASQIMAESAKARIDRAVSLANPIAIVVLGGVVALLVAGVMLGIFALGDFAG